MSQDCEEPVPLFSRRRSVIFHGGGPGEHHLAVFVTARICRWSCLCQSENLFCNFTPEETNSKHCSFVFLKWSHLCVDAQLTLDLVAMQIFDGANGLVWPQR